MDFEWEIFQVLKLKDSYQQTLYFPINAHSLMFIYINQK